MEGTRTFAAVLLTTTPLPAAVAAPLENLLAGVNLPLLMGPLDNPSGDFTGVISDAVPVDAVFRTALTPKPVAEFIRVAPPLLTIWTVLSTAAAVEVVDAEVAGRYVSCSLSAFDLSIVQRVARLACLAAMTSRSADSCFSASLRGRGSDQYM